MKYTFTFLLVIIAINSSANNNLRIWSNQGSDNGAIHSLGNGKMLVYEQGPQIIKVYPGPYTSPSLYKFLLEDDKRIEVTSSRQRGTAIWNHEVESGNEALGKIRDYVDSELPVMIRHLSLLASLTFRIELTSDIVVLENRNPSAERKSILLRTKPGALIYQNYVYPDPIYHEIRIEGEGIIEKSEKETNVFYLTCKKGEMNIFLIGGPDYSQVMRNSEEVIQSGNSVLLDRTKNWWNKYTEKRYDFQNKFPDDLPLRDELLQIIDDVAVMMRTQQAGEGAVMAGYPYPLGYVRDQYGVSRGIPY